MTMTNTPTDNARAAAEIVARLRSYTNGPLNQGGLTIGLIDAQVILAAMTAERDHMPSPDTHAAKVKVRFPPEDEWSAQTEQERYRWLVDNGFMRAPTPQPAVAETVERAVKSERERCAKIARDQFKTGDLHAAGCTIAGVILGTREAK